MTSIAPTATTGILPSYADPNAPSAGLTADGLLLYCSARLATIDDTIEQYFVKQQHGNKTMRDASNLMSVLSGFPNGASSREGMDAATGDHKTKIKDGHVNMANGLLHAYASTNDPELKAKMHQAFKMATGRELSEFVNPDGSTRPFVEGDLGTWDAVSKEQWDALAEDVKGVQSSVSKGSELNMIQLQSLVSQRQLAVQLTTQLMQTLHEAAKQAVGNIR